MMGRALKVVTHRKRKLLLAFLVVAIAATALAVTLAVRNYGDSSWPGLPFGSQRNFKPTAPFPLDPAVRVGRLDNDLTYYIVPNDDPADRILLTLVVHAGSLNEDDDQKGVAHFLEHMMFNGTNHFSTEQLRQYFEANGIPLGQHLNAYTTYEHTVYFVSLDQSQHEAIEAGFTLLSDWTHGSLLQREEVEKEKGVVEEEWRLSQEDAWDRTWSQIWQILLDGSLHADREPIGDIDVIRTLTPDLLRRFQQDWYRPDLMTVIVIGEMEPEWAEQQIQKYFAALPVPAAARQPIAVQFPAQTQGHIEVRADPALTEVWLQVFQLMEAHPLETLEDYRQVLLTELADWLLYFRLDDLHDLSEVRYEEPVTDLARQDFGGVILASLETRLSEEFLMSGLAEILTELRNIQLHGFTRTELDDAKFSLLGMHEDDFGDARIRHNREIQEDILVHLTTGFPLISLEFELDLVRHYLPSISLREVNDFTARYLSPEHSLIFLAAPDRDDLVLPSTDEIRRILARRPSRTKRSTAELQPEADLLVEVPQPIDPVKQEWHPRLALHELTYANGVKALLKYNRTEEDKVELDLFSPGGRSLVDDDGFYSALLVADAILKSGAGQFDGDQLDRFLEYTSIYFEPYLAIPAEGYYGQTDADDLETLFQLVYLFVTQSRFDEGAFQRVLDDQRAELRNQILDPHFVLQDQVGALQYPDSRRLRPMLLADVADVDFGKAQQIYTERFEDMEVPTLTLVGDFELQEAKRLISTYIGTLTFSQKAERWQDQSVKPQSGPLRKYIHHGKGSQALVEQVYSNTQVEDLNQADAVALRALSRILHSRLEYQLREELGGTYYVDVYVWLWSGPYARSNLEVSFATNERQVEDLMRNSRTVMRAIQEQGVDAGEVRAAKEQLLAELKSDRNSNYHWIEALYDEIVYRSGNLNQIDRDEEYINNLTLRQINDLVPVVLNVDQLVEVALVPENPVPASSPD